MEVKWVLKTFDSLTPRELYDILRLRAEVFVVEQNCVYLDEDNKDQQAWHLMGWHENHLVAYVRIFSPGFPYREASIGRVVTSPARRGKGLGKLLMEEAIKYCSQLFHNPPIRIGAQAYLKKFYQSLGFEPCSDIYLEDGIEHMEMLRPS